MSTTINQDVIKAREVVAGYKELNKNTVEEVSYYDPILKLRRYKKVLIDPNSKEFIKLYGKKKNEKEKKDKPVKSVPFVAKTVKAKKPRKKVMKVPGTVRKSRYVPRPKKTNEDYDQTTLISRIYALHLKGIENNQIATDLNTTKRIVLSSIVNRKRSLGIEVNKRNFVSSDEVIRLFKLGHKQPAIAKMLGVCDSTIYNHLRVAKTDEQINNEREDVLRIIRGKCNLNQSNFIFGKMIIPAKCKYKYDISIMDVYKYCNELAQQGKIIIPDEPLMKHKGRKICLSIA